ncbi:MAG: hypothetical protein NT128_00180 [Proteobacteria bacterium]|nr:hypothetical protein [Pseudomonadota bacterium]
MLVSNLTMVVGMLFLAVMATSAGHGSGQSPDYVIEEVERYKLKLWRKALDSNHLNQEDINNVLIDAAFCGHKAIVELILNRPEGQLKPDTESVNKAFERVSRYGNTAIMNIIRAYWEIKN